VRAWRLPLAKGLLVLLLVPPEPAPTQEMRRVLPAVVPLETLVVTLGRCLALVEALRVGGDLYQTTRDDLHQPHRLALLPASREVLDFLRARDLPAFLSGAGPSVACLVKPGKRGVSEKAAREVLGRLPGWRLHLLQPAERGAVVTSRV
jgi:homoserine kinase